MKDLKQWKNQLIVSCFFFLLGTGYFIGTFFIHQYAGYGSQSVDSAFVPQILGLLMIGLSVILFVQTLQAKKTLALAPQVGSDAATEETLTEEIPDDDVVLKSANNRSFITILAVLVLYVALLEWIGFIIMTALFLFASIFILVPKEKRKLISIMIISVGTSLLVYYLFVYLLGLILPSGILPL